MRRWPQIALLVVLLVAIGFAVRRSATRLAVYRGAERVCAAVEAKDWATALRISSTDPPPTVAGLRAADCRCVALMQTGRKPECVALLERELAAPEARDWLPRPMLAAVVVESRQQRGDLPGALQLATQSIDHAPSNWPLLALEGQLRLQLATPREALQKMVARLPAAGDSGMRLRFFLAGEAMTHDQWEMATDILGDQPPPPPDRDVWYLYRTQALAHLGRTKQLLEAVETWERNGGNPARARATYAYLLSATQQLDPRGRSVTKMLAEGVAAGDRLEDPALLKSVYIRYVGMLALTGRREDALRYFDEGVARFGSLGHLERSDLQRTAKQAPSGGERGGTGTPLQFAVHGAQPGDRLLVSPDGDEPHDAPFREHPLARDGSLRLEPRFGTWPLRWVLRDARGAVRGSGAVWPAPGSAPDGSTLVRVERRRAVPPEVSLSTPRPAAGRRRLFVVILDCGEWRFVRYGLARHELPTFAALTENAAQGVLLSRPAFTAIAVRSIVQPSARRVDGVLGVLHGLGAEVAGLNFVGRNPLGALSWVLPGSVDLFETLGAGELRTANLLHSYGGLQVGRHGEIVGPHGVRDSVRLTVSRALRPDELALLAGVEGGDTRLLAEMAADFDNAVELAGPSGPDLVVLRVASLDLLTHGNFPATAAAGQDDGRPLLFRIYRYIDRRLGEIRRTLDGDDVLVVMSDHGIRTALQHDEQAMFLAAGGGAPAGRLVGFPEIRGVPRMIADFFGVATNWPSTRIESWLHVDDAARPSTP